MAVEFTHKGEIIVSNDHTETIVAIIDLEDKIINFPGTYAYADLDKFYKIMTKVMEQANECTEIGKGLSDCY